MLKLGAYVTSYPVEIAIAPPKSTASRAYFGVDVSDASWLGEKTAMLEAFDKSKDSPEFR
jgi:hypothetical protein